MVSKIRKFPIAIADRGKRITRAVADRGNAIVLVAGLVIVDYGVFRFDERAGWVILGLTLIGTVVIPMLVAKGRYL